MNEQAGPREPTLRAELDEQLQAQYRAAKDDPFANPVLHFAAGLNHRLEAGEIAAGEIEAVLRTLTAEAFAARADRVQHYFHETDPAANETAIRRLFEELARAQNFESFRDTVRRAAFGIVFTAHPTFALPLELTRALSGLGTGYGRGGEKLGGAERGALKALAASLPHAAPPDLTLETEHRWSVEALCTAHGALEGIYRIVLGVARARWPERWRELNPRLITLASWVGYDQDGRTDITWVNTIQKRLLLKQRAIERHAATLKAIADGRAEWGAALLPARELLDGAASAVTEQLALLALAQQSLRNVPAFARAMVKNSELSLADPAPLIARLDEILATAPDDTCRERLLIMRASLIAHGLSLAHTHVRLNAVQLHNAIRRQVGLQTSPNDPTSRRTYFAAINKLIEDAKPAAISFGSLMEERASAKRLMMTIAQMVKHIDRQTPVRFLIAETESAFTLLAALYYARLFGVEDHVELSPLFETEHALDRGERVIEEALKSPHYVTYLKRQGRMAMQFGFSDSGRFIGQLSATFRIERLRLRLALLLERHGLSDIEVILFNTHGESLGRGGHPATMADRLRYLAPPKNRAEFAARGIRTKEETSFQGGDGYVYFFNGAAALATLREALTFALQPPDELEDPIYDEPDYASELFATMQQEFAGLVDDPDYVAFLDLFGGNLIFKTGSRPTQRQSDYTSASPALTAVSELRAIPNNARLQQLGVLANVLHGAGRAAAKDKETFDAMRQNSPRFRRALEFVRAADELSDLSVTSAAVDTLDPGMWLARAAASDPSAENTALRELRDVAERIPLHNRLARVVRELRADNLLLAESLGPPELSARRRRLLLLHALRVALIQRVAILAMRVPDFSPQHGTTLVTVRERLLRLDIPATVRQLREIFPPRGDVVAAREDFGEETSYQPDEALSYSVEHETLFQPLLELHRMILMVSAAVSHECGACG
jgi:phosphoenolpyruvate carboxylase